MIVLSILALVALFYGIGKAADLVITQVRSVGKMLGLNIFFLGIVLGFFTSLPELAIGTNAVINDISSIAFGNLIGGTIILFSLILGLSLIVNRTIATEKKIGNFFTIVCYLFLPLIFGLDGTISFFDGFVLIACYVLLLLHLYKVFGHRQSVNVRSRFIAREVDVAKHVALIFIGCIAVMICAEGIMRVTLSLLEEVPIPPFILGLVVFSIGTNLPEVIVSIRSWKNKVKELSISNLIGSAMANPLMIGMFATMKAIPTVVDASYLFLMLYVLVLLVIVTIFYKTDHKLTEQEGVLLVGLYSLFIMSQFLLLEIHGVPNV